MGYTHYWASARGDDRFAATWPAIVASAEAIIGRLNGTAMVITGLFPGGAAVDPGQGIGFNGVIGAEQDGEPFVLRAPDPTVGSRMRWQFCKTGNMPYDLAVTALLLRCHLLLDDDFPIDSDGEWDGDWDRDRMDSHPTNPRRLVADLFGVAATGCPFTDTTRYAEARPGH